MSRKSRIAIAVAAVCLAPACAQLDELGRQLDGVSAGEGPTQQTQQAGGAQQQAGGAPQQQAGGPRLYVAPSTVRQVQQSLQRQGFDAGPVDGEWGPQTQQGVQAYQKAKGLEATGQLTLETLSSLGIQPGGQDGQSAGTGSTGEQGVPSKSQSESATGSGSSDSGKSR